MQEEDLLVPASLFVSYRRDDAAADARQVAAALIEAFGQDSVFIDVSTMGPGVRFQEAIEDAVEKCDALIVVIGKAWSSGSNLKKLQLPDDYVRLEVGGALRRRVPVVPVLVSGASIPSADSLPKDLETLPNHNAIELRHTSFDADLAQLVAGLEALGLSRLSAPGQTDAGIASATGKTSFRTAWIGFWGLVVAAVITGAVMLFTSSPDVHVKNGIGAGRDVNARDIIIEGQPPNETSR